MKQKVRSFTAAFLCTLLFLCLLCGFALADANTRKNGYGSFVPVAELCFTAEPLVYDIVLFGEEYSVSFKWLPVVKKYIWQLQRFVPLRYKAFGMAFFRIMAVAL
ncbi:MAG: hypothetical protein RR639_04950 [Hydrogenoanaerobacterium sp.]